LKAQEEARQAKLAAAEAARKLEAEKAAEAAEQRRIAEE